MKLASLLPFLDDEDLRELADKILKNEVKGLNIVTLYPFLSKDDMGYVFEKMIDEGNVKNLYSALPFLSKKQLDTLYDKVQAGEIEGFKESALVPFLGKGRIKDMFYKILESGNYDDSEDLNIHIVKDERGTHVHIDEDEE